MVLPLQTKRNRTHEKSMEVTEQTSFLSFIGSINYLAMSRKWNCIDDKISRMIKRFDSPPLCKNDHNSRKTWNEMKKNVTILFSTFVFVAGIVVALLWSLHSMKDISRSTWMLEELQTHNRENEESIVSIQRKTIMIWNKNHSDTYET